MRHQWRAVSLIHGDIRWANALGRTSGDDPRVWLVDWELACLGDPAWDVASLLADVVAAFVLVRGQAPVDDALTWSTHLLAGYANVARLPPDRWNELLVLSSRLAAVRLVQTIVEHGHVSNGELRAAEASLMPWAIRFLRDAEAVSEALSVGVSEGVPS